MGTQIGFREPSNAVVTGKYYTEYLKIGANATAAKMLPGIAVVRDTNDRSVKESGDAGAVIGVLGYEETPAAFKPTNRDTAYAVADTVAVHHGRGAFVRMLLEASMTIVKGDHMTVGADGYLHKATVGTDHIFSTAEESVTTPSDATGIIWVSLIN